MKHALEKEQNREQVDTDWGEDSISDKDSAIEKHNQAQPEDVENKASQGGDTQQKTSDSTKTQTQDVTSTQNNGEEKQLIQTNTVQTNSGNDGMLRQLVEQNNAQMIRNQLITAETTGPKPELNQAIVEKLGMETQRETQMGQPQTVMMQAEQAFRWPFPSPPIRVHIWLQQARRAPQPSQPFCRTAWFLLQKILIHLGLVQAVVRLDSTLW